MIIAKGENKKFKKSLVLKLQKQSNLLHKKPREDDFFSFSSLMLAYLNARMTPVLQTSKIQCNFRSPHILKFQ